MNDHVESVAVTFAVESLAGRGAEDGARFADMQEAHYREVAGFREVLDMLNPDMERYRAIEKQGRLHIVKARGWAGNLVGYSVHIVHTHLHYKHVLVAEDDVFYVMPIVRNRGVGGAMRAFAIETLKARGVKLVLARTKPHIRHSHLAKLGYELMETVFAKVL